MPSTDIFAVCCPFRKARVGFPVPGTVHISDDNDDDNELNHTACKANSFATFGLEEQGFHDRNPSSGKSDVQGGGDGKCNVLDGVVEKHREPRLLDAQFDNFKRSFDDEDSSSEDEEIDNLRQYANRETGDEDVIFALLTGMINRD